MIVIGLTGRTPNGSAGAGKDTVADRLEQAHGFHRFALADAVRQCLYAMKDIHVPIVTPNTNGISETWTPLHKVIDTKGWEEAKKLPMVRSLMQQMGTEAGRLVIGHNTWNDVARRKLKEIQKQDVNARVVITDIRFPNEGFLVREFGGYIVEINRMEPRLQRINASQTTHVSEQCRIKPDFVIDNNSTMRNLVANVDQTMKKITYYHNPNK